MHSMMRNSHLRWLLGLMAALSLIAAACGDDSGGDGNTATGGDGGDEVAIPECLDFPALYALTGPESVGFTNWSDATDLATTVGSAYADQFPDAPLDITGPGEESGTYDSYVSFAIEPIAEAQGLPEEEWVTRPDYTSSPNDNVIIEGVEGSGSSLGWVGFAYAEEAGDQVREFEIAGDDGTCVAPNADTIASGEYPMSRPLYIYVSQASLADNPAVAAYVDYYLGDDGYQAVADAGYVQVDEGTWGETQSAWSDAGGSPGEPASGVSGDVVVSGSSTVEPISSAIAEAFSADNPGVGISVDGPGTGDGFELFCAGETDISDASRAIEDEEAQACADAGIEYVELYIGIDGLSVLTAG
jgi:ABC-type phosphate transport system substrate-binding protein